MRRRLALFTGRPDQPRRSHHIGVHALRHRPGQPPERPRARRLDRPPRQRAVNCCRFRGSLQVPNVSGAVTVTASGPHHVTASATATTPMRPANRAVPTAASALQRIRVRGIMACMPMVLCVTTPQPTNGGGLRGLRDYLLVVLPVVAAFAGGTYILWSFETNAYFDTPHHLAEMRDPGHRYRVSLAVFTNIGAALLLIWLSGRMTWCAAGANACNWILYKLTPVLAVSAGFGIIWECLEAKQHLYDRIGSQVFRVMGCDDLSLLNTYTTITNCVVALSVASLAMAVAGRPKPRELHILLVSAAAVLVSGVLFTHSWTSWPHAYLVHGPPAERYSSAATWLTVNAAGIYTAMLALLFVPRLSFGEIESWANKESLQKILALLSPIVAALVVELAKLAVGNP